VLQSFDDVLAYRADLGLGIGEGLLAPFAYYGLRDVVDYANIPWRNRRFVPEALAAAVQTQARMERLRGRMEGARRRPVARLLRVHPARPFRRARPARGGVRVVSVHSEFDSADRDEALARLTRGELDAVCSVDLFNEAWTSRRSTASVMLRPTESPVVFLQQLGRGLRRADGRSGSSSSTSSATTGSSSTASDRS
jgi:superfamily II DNA or RNA helicase